MLIVFPPFFLIEVLFAFLIELGHGCFKIFFNVSKPLLNLVIAIFFLFCFSFELFLFGIPTKDSCPACGLDQGVKEEQEAIVFGQSLGINFLNLIKQKITSLQKFVNFVV